MAECASGDGAWRGADHIALQIGQSAERKRGRSWSAGIKHGTYRHDIRIGCGGDGAGGEEAEGAFTCVACGESECAIGLRFMNHDPERSCAATEIRKLESDIAVALHKILLTDLKGSYFGKTGLTWWCRVVCAVVGVGIRAVNQAGLRMCGGAK